LLLQVGQDQYLMLFVCGAVQMLLVMYCVLLIVV
jgi:hypothetical protein